jgi:hypothetical protein
MSNTQPHRRHSKLVDDEVGEVDVNRAGGWSRQEVEKMDAAFVAAVRRAHPAAEVGEGQQKGLQP